MKFKYGTYSHEIDEVAITTDRETLRDDAGRQIGYRETWTLDGELQGADAEECSYLALALVSAYSVDGRDCGLYEDDGTTETHLNWRDRDTWDGVRVIKPPFFPVGRNGELANHRTYQIVLRADFESINAPNIIAWTESIQRVGNGGARIGVIEPRNKKPILQMLNRYTAVRLIQSGQAVGRRSRPTPPKPLYPQYLQNPEEAIQVGAPTLMGNRYVDFPISWNYQMILPGPASPQPNYWPRNT